METVLLFIAVLAVLVLAHEFGHFLTARWAKMRIFEFGFGFPPRLFGVYQDPEKKKMVWVWGKNKKATELPATVYSLNLLPLGGFVRIKGEEGGGQTDADSFAFQKPGKRMLVLVAGVLMNIILAGILLSVGFMIGLPTDLSLGQDPRAQVIGEPQVMVQHVEAGSPAEKAGIRYGDRVTKINGQDIVGSAEMVELVKAEGGQAVAVTISKDEKEQTVDITPALIKPGDSYPRLGVMLADAAMVKYPWYWAIIKGFTAAGIGLINIFIAFYLLLKNLILGQGLAFEVSGPVGIAVMVGDSARLGLNYLINVTAMISLSLAAINILPIPALDGGRLVFVFLEKVLRRPVPVKYEQAAHAIGYILLLALIVVVTGRDILGLIK